LEEVKRIRDAVATEASILTD
jgi:hypothetical protein